MIDQISNIASSGLTLDSAWALASVVAATGVGLAIHNRLRTFLAYKWVRGNKNLALGSTWCRFGTSTGHFDARLRSISQRSVRFDVWSSESMCFEGVYRIPTVSFVNTELYTILTSPTKEGE